MKSVASRIVVAGVFVTAGAGWIGVETAPSTAAPATVAVSGSTAAVAQPGVRDRTAWQPSPVPSQSQPAQPVQVVQSAPASQPAQTAPSVRDRSAWQPSPIPGQSQAQPQTKTSEAAPVQAPPAPLPGGQVGIATPSVFTRFTDWVKSILLKPSGKMPVIEPLEPAPSQVVSDEVIPMTELFNQDVLESMFEGALPETRGEWKIVSFQSKALGREMAYMAYLPPGYDASKHRYPTLYLLHGVGSPEAYGPEEWLGYSLTETMDRMLAAELIEPMIMVLPTGDQSYWMNHAGGPRWGDYVAQDLVKHVDATFRTDARREKRAIGGLSMGGHGAVQLAYNHADVFSVAGAHSPTLRPFETSPEFFGDPAYFAKHDPISLARSGQSARRVLTWIDVGAQDEWLSGAQTLRDALVARKAPLEFRVLEGEHEGWYWQYYLPEYLHFYSRALYAPGVSSSGAPVVASQLLTSTGVSSAVSGTQS
jgi:enterochelin esterase-like enzyme